MIVQVTQTDIAHGVPGECDNCPVALALLRTVPGAVRAEVTAYIVRYFLAADPNEPQRWRSFSPSSALRRFIENFDNELPVEPFDFELPWESPPAEGTSSRRTL